jgi:peptide-methionine (R)-S-oxide reductase
VPLHPAKLETELGVFMQRRNFITMALTGAALGSLMYIGVKPKKAFSAPAVFEVTKTDEAWKKQLTSEQFHILREEGTEAPFTSALVKEHREGTFHCAGCDHPLFLSNAKYDSFTGWPSFFDSIKGHLATHQDTSLLMTRTEFHCARCGGHHGHIFEDGPQPTGLRYCSNGAVLNFKPKAGV